VDVFPSDLPGLGWSVTKAPEFATRIQTSISGRELRSLDMPLAVWTWTLTYDFLRDGNNTAFGGAQGLGAGKQELRELMGFFARQQGSFNTFLYNDPTDNTVTNQAIGAGDGVNSTFQLSRILLSPTFPGGLSSDPITQPNQITGVFVAGVVAPYTLNPYGQLRLVSVPPPGALVTATFTYRWPVRFLADTYEFENFMLGLWTLKKIQFKSVLLP
jgi:uncharacterized protein (TIGR02217 family)